MTKHNLLKAKGPRLESRRAIKRLNRLWAKFLIQIGNEAPFGPLECWKLEMNCILMKFAT